MSYTHQPSLVSPTRPTPTPHTQVLDAQELQGVAQALPVSIRGEAYSVAVDVRFPQPGLTGLDFGTVRVSESPSQAVALKNLGKYPVAFKVEVRQGLAAELLGVVPEEGAIEPGKEVTLQVGRAWYCVC